MKYDFDKVIPRRGTDCVKWDESNDEQVVPMWVADMDFQVAQPIIDALQKRVAHGIFGYTHVPESYYEAVQNWFSRRHQWIISRDSIIYTTGVVPAITCAIKAICLPGENVLIQTPVYNCFFSCVRNCGCNVLENPLKRQGGSYVIDFDDFERKCAEDKTTAFLLCNPHNPAGRVWTREELQRLSDICQRHGVRIISDEIHCEIVMPGVEFVPFGTVQEDAVILNSPSKSFNIAGLQIANIICADASLRRRINRVVNIHEVCDVNPFGPIALQAAYNECEDWLDQLNEYIAGNYQALKDFLAAELPKLHVCKLEGTYLAWVDINAAELTSDEAAELLLNDGKVMVCTGTMYGRRAGQGYLRVNLACPRSVLMDGLRRFGRVLSQYIPDDYDLGCPM